MNRQNNETELRRNTVAIAIWENEGGAPSRDLAEHQYGRRVEADRSWTVYHVFTGVAARVGDDDLIGLSRSQATSSMMSLNPAEPPTSGAMPSGSVWGRWRTNSLCFSKIGSGL